MARDAEGSAPEVRGAREREGPLPEELGVLWNVPSMAAFVIDKEHRIRSANAGFAALVTWKHAALPGRRLEEVIHIASKVIGDMVDRAIATGEPAVGLRAPFDWVDLTFDVIPVGVGTDDPRAVVMAADPRHTPIDAPEGAAGIRFAFFEFAARLARVRSEESTAMIEEALRFVAQTYELERAYVRIRADDEENYTTPYEYHAPHLSPISPREITAKSIAWANERFLRGETIILSSPGDLPPDELAFRAALERVGVRATISVPILDGTRLLGYVGYPATEGRRWTQAEVHRLRHLGEVIAAVIVRSRAEADFCDRFRFEEQLSAAATRFVHIAPEDVDAEIQRSLEGIGAALKVDRATVALLDEEGTTLALTHAWCAPGVEAIEADRTSRRVEDLTQIVRRALAGEAVAGREEDAPAGSEAAELLERTQAHGFAIAPLHVDGQVSGVMTIQTLRHRRDDPPAYLARVKLIADVIAAALSQRAAQQRTLRWERRLHQILESAMDGVVVVDPSGLVRQWTTQATTVFGRQREEVLGKPMASLVHEDDRGALGARIASVGSTPATAQRFEIRGLCSSGKVVPIELSMTRIERSEGALIATFVRDITDRKRIEAEKQRAFEEVSHQKRTLERERDYLREERGTSAILGESPAIRQTIEMIDAVADTTSSVLLLGESGVGKEVLATAVHERSRRAGGPFVKVNCASVPGSLFESEFFGHVKGSFTGAVKDRIGRFELADKGTLFLDEVGEIPFELQSKLLRVLQEGEIERVGEDRTRKLDVRIVAATNRNLEEEVEEGRFRRDLYFRLSVFPIAVPPLRERGQDILILARHFLDRHLARARRSDLSLSPDDELRLVAYDWPGNVRELDHILERAVILSRDPPLRLDLALPYRGPPRPSAAPEILRDDDLRRLERENIALALKKSSGRVGGTGGAAELLGMHPSTLRDRMKSFGLSRAD